MTIQPHRLLLLSLLLACDPAPTSPSTAASNATVAVSVSVSASTSAPVRELAEAPQALVLLRHEPASKTGTLLPMTLPASWPGEAKLLGQFEVAAVPHRFGGAHYEVVASHEGGRIAVADAVVATTPDAGGEAAATSWRIARWRLHGAKEGDDVELGARRPWALSHQGDRIYVGVAGAVGSIDLRAAAPTYQRVHGRKDGGNKAYDLFVREGDRLIAIDDRVVPLYADLFRIAAGGALQHRAAWRLPGIINGRYYLGDLARRGPADDGTLLLVARYGIQSGSGHDLLALPISGEKLSYPDGFVVNARSGGNDDPAVMQEHLGAQATLAAGNRLTRWQGMGVLAGDDRNGRIALAAAGRGIMLVPLGFDSKTKAELVDVGGSCRDLLAHDDLVYALVAIGGDAGATSGALVVMRWRAPKLERVAEVKLPAVYQRILR